MWKWGLLNATAAQAVERTTKPTLNDPSLFLALRSVSPHSKQTEPTFSIPRSHRNSPAPFLHPSNISKTLKRMQAPSTRLAGLQRPLPLRTQCRQPIGMRHSVVCAAQTKVCLAFSRLHFPPPSPHPPPPPSSRAPRRRIPLPHPHPRPNYPQSSSPWPPRAPPPARCSTASTLALACSFTTPHPS
jgi:hypothetical protein